MFESFLAVPLHFTVEFLGFLVAIGGALLVVSRPELIPGPTSNRYSVALGLGVLAAAQALHGGAFYPGDGEQVIVALRALAYALVLIGVVGGMRPAVAAVAGFELEEPLLLAPAGIAALVGVVALRGSSQPGSRIRRLGLGFLALAVSELLLSSTVPTAEFGTVEADRFSYAAHGAKAIGFLLVGAWVWSAARSSIRVRYVASFGALLVAVVLALSTGLAGVISNSVQTGELDRIEEQASQAADAISDEIAAELTRSVRQVAGSNFVTTSLATGRDPVSLAREIEESDLWETDFIVVDPRKALPGFLGDGPSVRGRAVQPIVTELTEGLRAGLVGSGVAREVIKGARPISAAVDRVIDVKSGREYVAVIAAARVTDAGRSVGAIVFGQWVDALMLEGVTAPLSGARAAVLIDESKIAASDMSRRLRRDLSIPSDADLELSLTGNASEPVSLGGTRYFAGFADLSDRGVDVATLVITSEANVIAETRSGVNRLLFVATMLVAATALVLAWASGRRITRPIQQLTATAQLVREGNLDAKAEVEGADEVGQLGDTFNEMTSSLLKMTSDLRRAAREEHDLRYRIETIIQSMADGLVAVDSDRNILAFNREAEYLIGVTAEDAMGRPVADIITARDAQGQDIHLPIHTLSEGSLGTAFVVRPDGDSTPVAVTSAVLRDEEDEISGGVMVLRDMTREREIERMKTEFLSNISHELRTPLTPIKGYAEILGRREVPKEKLQQFVSGILESTGRLERIVELLVDFAAMEAGRMSPRSGEVDVAELLEDLSERWKKRAPAHELITEVPAGLPHMVGDERLLRRSIEEILDNAVKFSPHGGKIRLQAREAVNGAGIPERIEVVVTDEGIGISPEDLPNIFSDFHQLDGSETRTYGGLGLGLAFVRRIAQVHDGEVRVESEPDHGTSLTIAIPAAAGGDD